MSIQELIYPLLVAASQKAAEASNYDPEHMQKTLEDRFRLAYNEKLAEGRYQGHLSWNSVPGHNRNWHRQNPAISDTVGDGQHEMENGPHYFTIKRTGGGTGSSPAPF